MRSAAGFLVAAAVAASAPAAAAAGADAVNNRTLPHIVFMLTDNVGYGNIGFTREVSPAGPSPEVQTPTLDSLAASGVVLDRMYCYKFCSPSRSSFLSGRLPVHVNVNNDDQTIPGAGVPTQMTTLPRKLKDAGYATHHIGKWHAGMATPAHTPMGRGFDTSIGYLWAYNGYLHGWANSAACPEYPGKVSYPADANGTIPGPGEKARCTASSVAARNLQHITDLWRVENGEEGPATGLNASFEGAGFEEAYFVAEAERLIAAHGKKLLGRNADGKHSGNHGDQDNQPFFLYYAMHLLHSPLCAPPELLDRFSFVDNEDRRYVSAMAAYLDQVVGRVVSALKLANMWDNTVFVWQSDNGAAIELTTGAKSAYPLRGGYYTNWEGGVRAPALVNGGFLVKEAAKNKIPSGQRVTGLMHIADWYATFCALAGVDATDASAASAGLPPVDSLNMWPSISSGNGSITPRTEIFMTPLNDTAGHGGDAAIIIGQYKLIVGQIGQASWCGVEYPNATKWDTWSTVLKCPVEANKVGCLFNIFDDPTEHVDLAATNLSLAQNMYARLLEAQKDFFNPNRGASQRAEACEQVVQYGGFWGPWINISIDRANERN